MNQQELEELIRKSLENFYAARIKGLSTLKLRTVLRKKNPYLFRAVGVQKASEIVAEVLRAHVTSSDETIFGNAFFEAIAVICSGGRVSDSEGVDVTVETDTVYKAVAVKSGPNIFNSSAAKRQDQEFRSLASRLLKIHKQFNPLLGLGYGRKNAEPTKDRSYRIRSGQVFWEEITGDPDFYLKLIELMRDYPIQHRIEFEKEWSKAINRFEYDFLINFGNEDGSIDWNKLLIFNSGKEKPRWIKVTATTVVEEQEDTTEEEAEDFNGDQEEV